MPIIHQETIVEAPIMRVWMFFMDPVKNLPRISSPEDAVVVESADLPIREGSVVVIAARDPLGRRIRWESRIEQMTAPRAVITGMEGRFVDVQTAGPFKEWKHEHEFEAVDSKTTRVIDRITYRPRMGLLGMILDMVYLRWRLRGMISSRGRALRKAMGA